jgi:DNA (cytosine-5)-methyltransferase 1
MRLIGELFAGIGGFGLGFEREGFECSWQVEIDESCQRVLEKWFPNSRKFRDVREVGKHNLSEVDIITFGSPCQDLSIAGDRKGLSGDRSGLFFEATRIIRELKPEYAVWENVPGAFSSNNGADFQAVLSEMLGTSIPMPRSGRWANAGMVRSGQTELAWRLLDSQYFGLAQRRKRVFLVAGFGGRSAAEILFESEGRARNTPPHREAQNKYPDVSGTLTANAGGLSRPAGNANEIDFCIPLAHTITTRTGMRHDPTTDTYVTYGIRSGNTSSNGCGIQEDITHTLDTSSPHFVGGCFGVRRLTPLECERLQGFDDGWTDGQSDIDRYRQLGNAVSVKVTRWIAKRVKKFGG